MRKPTYALSILKDFEAWSGPRSPVAQLTAEQCAAVGEVQASVALRAGAGCGKTLVLTERYRREIERQGGRPLGSVLVLTFTDKAAREAAQRIRQLCHDQLASGQDVARWTLISRAWRRADRDLP